MPTVVGEMMPLRFGCVCSSALGLLEGLLVVVVAVDGVDELDAWCTPASSSSFFISSIQAFWLVALAVADRIAISPPSAPICFGDQLDLDFGDALGGGLVDEQVAAVRVGVGVEGDDLGAGVAGLVEGAADGVRVVGRRSAMTFVPCCVSGVDVADLADGAGLGRADLAVGALELLDRRLAAACRDVSK